MPSRSAGLAKRPRLAAMKDDRRWNVEESRSVRSAWIWRGFLVMSMVAVGIAIIMAGNGHSTLGIEWGVIAAGWFAISMWLWKKHSRLFR
jgi:hypothetical protein